jgi:hypothetical protein
VLAVIAVVLSGVSICWQVGIEIRRRKSVVHVLYALDQRDLVVTVINRGDVAEMVRYLGFERRLNFFEGALADGNRMSFGLAGAFSDPVRAREQRAFSEMETVDIGTAKEFDPAAIVAPRGDLIWRIPLTELRGRRWRRGCYARVRLATGLVVTYPRWALIQRFYGRLLENALAGLPEESTPSEPSAT